MMENADQLVNLGLANMGFAYVNLDGGWQGGRFPNGSVYENSTSFPSGMKALADYVHSKGLLFGSYTDRGQSTCDGHVGSLGHELRDAVSGYASPSRAFHIAGCPGVAAPDSSRLLTLLLRRACPHAANVRVVGRRFCQRGLLWRQHVSHWCPGPIPDTSKRD